MYKKITKTRKIIRRLIKVMEIVVKEKRPFIMSTWFITGGYQGSGAKSVHHCNTPACVAGYGSLDTTICTLAQLKRGHASRLNCRLDAIAHSEYAFIHRHDEFNSILFNSSANSRYNAFTDIFPKQDPGKFRHLTAFSPKAKDVIKLLKALDGYLAKAA